ncbi:MAG: hypothetical protein R2941_26015, partial [Desulfobacterales bacterium]
MKRQLSLMLIFSLCFVFFSTSSIGQSAPVPEKKPEAAVTEAAKSEADLPKPDPALPEVPKPGTDLLKPDSAAPEIPKPAAEPPEKKKESAVS